MNKKIGLLCAGLLLVVAASVGAIVMQEKGGTTAVISRDGVVLHEIRLDELLEPKTLRIEGENGEVNLVEVSRGRVRMASASCPDQICIQQGYIYAEDGAVPIVCLPNKVIVSIKGGDDSLDAATH